MVTVAIEVVAVLGGVGSYGPHREVVLGPGALVNPQFTSKPLAVLHEGHIHTGHPVHQATGGGYFVGTIKEIPQCH